MLQPLGERLQAHCANHQDQVLLPFRFMSRKNLATESLRQIRKRRQHPARINQPIRCGKKKFAQLEKRKQPAAPLLIIEHGKNPDIVLIH